MKKRNKIITFISSIFSCIAIFGALVVGLIFDDRQQVSETQAVNTLLYSYTGNFNGVTYLNRVSDYNSFSANYIVSTYQDISGSAVNRYTYTINLYLEKILLRGGTYDGYKIMFDSSSAIVYTYSSNVAFNTIRLEYGISTRNTTTQSRFATLRYKYYFYADNEVDNYNVSGLVDSSDEGLPSQWMLNSNNQQVSNVSGEELANTIRNETIYIEGSPVNTPMGNNQEISVVETDTSVYAGGYNDGYADGVAQGTQDGYAQGVLDGKEEQSQVDSQLFDDYYAQGYAAGYDEGSNQDATVTSIFGGITSVALVPINFFLSVFNFEILGVNIASVVSALMSICLILIVWKAVMGGKSSD